MKMKMKMLPFIGPPCDLTLNYCPTTTKTSSSVPSSPLGDEEEGVDKLEEYLKGLEKERFKIEAFKRELPFSMQLLNDVIEASKSQLANYESRRSLTDEEQRVGKPAREKFIPVNKSCEVPLAKKSKVATSGAKCDIPDWMRSAGLWNHRHDTEENTIQDMDSHPQKTFPLSGSTNNLLDYKNRIGGAFLPFSRERQQQTSSCSDVGEQGAASHSSSYNKGLTHKAKETVNDEGITPNPNTSDGAISNLNVTSDTSTKRKVRRCWSPELHKKFVSALQQLGGTHATPKHIRELMKVDGLTNDEVKSHLQKYRLHTRRSSPNRPQLSQQSHGPQLVMVGVGGIWVPHTQGHYYCQEASPCIGGEEKFYTITAPYSFQQPAQGDPQSSCISVDGRKGNSSR